MAQLLTFLESNIMHINYRLSMQDCKNTNMIIESLITLALLHSPLTLGYRDAEGHFAGLAEDGKKVIEIPGAQYERYGEVQ